MVRETKNVFEPGTLVPRGMYIRKCDTGLYNKQYFANQADKERELRLMLDDPANWMSHFFRKERNHEEVLVLLNNLASHLQKAGYEVFNLDNFIGELHEIVNHTN